ncbi:MAG: KGGVGR-motif variant AAA ATPase, partial [Candidatus Hodarchaeota archaeon]
MAVANIAALMAQAGYRVVTVDWDLEAPGLHRYFGFEDSQSTAGVIDFFYEYRALLASDSRIDPEVLPKLDSFLMKVSIPRAKGTLHLMPAGKQGHEYSQRVRDFDWKDFYAQWDGMRCVEFLKYQLTTHADYVVVDSRTGVTDVGGICTIQLPEIVVLMSGTNAQGTENTERIARNLLDNPALAILEKKLAILPVPSRVEDRTERDLFRKWITDFRSRLGEFLPREISRAGGKEYFDRVYIPYVPKFSFGEQLAILAEDIYEERSISAAYRFLLGCITAYTEKAPITAAQELIVRLDDDVEGSDQEKPVSMSISVPQLELEASNLRFVAPLTDRDLSDIRWYLEIYPKWPLGPDYSRAEQVESNLEKWGQSLFDALFTQGDVRDIYMRFIQSSAASRLLTIESSNDHALKLPWELLSDGRGFLVSSRPPVGIRRRLPGVAPSRISRFELPVRILVVVSRPEDVPFFDSRTTAEALLNSVESLGWSVEVEFLRPPTLEALALRLRDSSGHPVHIVHFDGHGYYSAQTGLGYLYFEDGAGQVDAVDSQRLGTLLNQCDIALVILEACSTAHSEEHHPHSNVATQLIRSGITSVLAMNYAVHLEMARQFSTAFYRSLVNGTTVGQAVDAARLALIADSKRIDLYREGKDEHIHLQDWFLPVLYQQGADPAPFQAVSTPTEKAKSKEYLPIYPAQGGFPSEPRYGFHGRSRELRKLERLFADHNIVVLHGFGGVGKTAFATHTAHWFVRTNLFKRAVFVSFERGADVEYVLAEVGTALLGESFRIHEGEPIDIIAKELDLTSTLIVWDNIESVLQGGDAQLSPEALKEVLDLGAHWVQQLDDRFGSRLLVTTRSSDIPHPAFKPGSACCHYEFQGLALLEALSLVANILDAYAIAFPNREEMVKLLQYLEGHPLSIQLVMPRLRDTSINQLLDDFDTLLPDFREGDGVERNQSLQVSLEYSLKYLGPETRGLISDLAVFQGGAHETMLLAVTGFDAEKWQRLGQELEQAALLTIENLPFDTTLKGHQQISVADFAVPTDLLKAHQVENIGQPFIQATVLGTTFELSEISKDIDSVASVSVPIAVQEPRRDQKIEDSAILRSNRYVRFHPVLSPYLAANLTGERRAYLERRFRDEYYRLAYFLYIADHENPVATRLLAVREMPNLRYALELTIAAGDIEKTASFADCVATFLDHFGRWRERDTLVRQVQEFVSVAAVSGEVGSSEATFLQASRQAITLLSQGRASEAEHMLREILARIEQGTGFDTSYVRNVTLGN